MKHVLSIVAVLLLAGCGGGGGDKTAGQEQGKEKQAEGSGNPITAPLDYVGAAGKAQKAAVKTIDLASVNQAIQMFRVQEDRYPGNLNELVAEGLLRSLPATPAGTRFEYNSQNGSVRIVPVAAGR